MKCTCTLVKKSALKKPLMAAKKAGAVVNFQFVDNEDSTCTVNGVDAAGNTVDIDTVATITVSSGDTTVITVDSPVGMTFAMRAVGKLSTVGTPVQVSVTATWTDAAAGPVSFSLPVDVVAGKASGVVIVPGTPTVH